MTTTTQSTQITLTIDRDRDSVIRRLRNQLESAQTTLTRFQRRMANLDPKTGEAMDPRGVTRAPAYALEWSMDAFDVAAEIEVLGFILAALTAEEESWTTEVLVKQALRESLRAAASPPRSTSPVSNLMAQSRAAVWAEIARDLLCL